MQTFTQTHTRIRQTAYAFLISKEMRHVDAEFTSTGQSCVLPVGTEWELLLHTNTNGPNPAGYFWVPLSQERLQVLARLYRDFQVFIRRHPKTYSLNGGEITWGQHYTGSPGLHLVRRLARDPMFSRDEGLGMVTTWVNPHGFFWNYTGREEETEWETGIVPGRLLAWLLKQPKIPDGLIFDDLPSAVRKVRSPP